MWRRIAVGGSAGLFAVLALCAGCGSDGNYQVTWNFFASPDAQGDPVEAFAACGAHGVDAIQVVAVNADGDAMFVWDNNPGNVPYFISAVIHPRLLADK